VKNFPKNLMDSSTTAQLRKLAIQLWQIAPISGAGLK
jgi:hypothetical protein